MSGFLACTHFNWHEKNTKGYGVGKKHVWKQIEIENSGLFLF